MPNHFITPLEYARTQIRCCEDVIHNKNPTMTPEQKRLLKAKVLHAMGSVEVAPLSHWEKVTEWDESSIAARNP